MNIRKAIYVVALVLAAMLMLFAAHRAMAGLKNTTTCYGYGRYVGAGAVVKLTTAATTGINMPITQRPDGSFGKPSYVVIVVEGTGTVRWADGGTVPTSTVGTPLQPTAELDYDGDLNAIQLFLPSGATMSVNYYD